MFLSPSRAFLAAALVLVPLAAQSATLVFPTNLIVGQFVTEAQVINPGDSFEFRYTALEALDIASFALSATGNRGGLDIADIRFGLTLPGTNVFTDIHDQGTSAYAGAFLPGLRLAAGDIFSIFFSDGISNPVGLTLSFITEEPSHVPLPASAPLLGLGLLGLILTRGRKLRARLSA
jgi:hypothetical protein